MPLKLRAAQEEPRIANRLLKRVRDFAQVQSDGKIDRAIADKALTLLQVDHQGLIMSIKIVENND